MRMTIRCAVPRLKRRSLCRASGGSTHVEPVVRLRLGSFMPVFTSRSHVLSAVLLATTALYAAGAQAQSRVQSPPMAELDEVVVIAAGREQ